MTFEKMILIVFVIWLALTSLIAMTLYGKDKKMATKGGGPVRIKEKTLLGITAIGGAVGALIGRILFHHKTDKMYFSLTIFFSILVEALTLGALVFIAFM